MSRMDFSNTNGLKNDVISSEPKLRKLVLEHRRCEARLSELSGLAYPTDDEHVEEIALKKKKLSLEGQMNSLMTPYRKEKRSKGKLRGSTTETPPEQVFPEPRTRLIEAAFAAHAEYLEHGEGPISIEEINAEVAERRGGVMGDASH